MNESERIKAELELLTGDAALLPLGMPDVYVDDGAAWECECGGLKFGPWTATHPGTVVSSRCPGCGIVVAIAPGVSEG